MLKATGVRIEKTGYFNRPTMVNEGNILKQIANIDSAELMHILWHNICMPLDANDEYTARDQALVSYHESGDKTYTLTGPGGTLVSN